MKNKLKRSIISAIIAIVAVLTFAFSFNYNVKDREVLVFQFGTYIQMRECILRYHISKLLNQYLWEKEFMISHGPM